ncbi:MAG TPA: cytochrome D1 domain-containing protein [Pyrinomonadaceae bacterium]|nr:cytochrome D1 domain-containing protein [Pyrinomonadaceae bacterium]
MSLRIAILLLTLLAGGASLAVRSQQKPTDTSQTFTQEGVSVSFTVEKPVAGHESTVRFKIVDTNSGKALSSLRPTAWIDRRHGGQLTDARQCREKIQSFLQPNFNRRPELDLNAYFILALNREPNISVIDPLSGFGGSKLYTLIPLVEAGEDWVLSADKRRLYVSMPGANKVAAIDTASWKVVSNIDAGVKPTRTALQNDNRYLWVSNEGTDQRSSGVTVIDTVSGKVAATIKTGIGPHEIAFTHNDSTAFITNKADGTVSVIDIRKLALVKNIPVGAQPVSIDFSPLGRTLYVANEGDGTIVAIDGVRFEITARLRAEPGLRLIRLEPHQRFGFAVNSAKNTVHIFDTASNRLLHIVPVGRTPDQLTFTSQFAYVRSTGSEFVDMIKLANITKEAAVTHFPAGEKAPAKSPARSPANAIVPAPEDGSVLVANPADQMIYYYSEGMAAPMGSFQNYRRDPKALLVLDNSLVETDQGVYSTTIRLSGAGDYDVAFLLDSPRVINCFNLKVVDDPNQPTITAAALKIEPLWKDMARAGSSFNLRFKVTVSGPGQPNQKLEDLGVLVFLAPGIWQHREVARPLGDGVYEINFVPPQTGIYYVYFQCPSLELRYNQTRPVTIEAVKDGSAANN